MSTQETAMKRRIGELVSQESAELGLSRYQMADRAGVAAGTLYTLEKGKAWPQPAKLAAIVSALGWRPRAIQQLLDSERDPESVTLDDVRAVQVAPARTLKDISDEELMAELSMRILVKNRRLKELEAN